MAVRIGEGASALSLLRPLDRHVILEPAYDPETTESGIQVPLDSRQRYPQIGYCIASASPHIQVNDLCLINVESSDVARTYQRVLAIHLEAWGTEIFEPDVEPAIREAYEIYRRNPSTDDKRIRVVNLRGEHLQFLASDILAMEWSTTDSAGFNLLYPMNVRIWDAPDGKMYYFVHEDNIMGVLE